jgi:RNA polymerase sigma-70 factor (ECF subfamily)
MQNGFALSDSISIAGQARTMIKQGSDEELIEAIAAGDRWSMQCLFLRHNVRVYRFILRLVGNATVAEDLTSTVFLDVWRQAGRFQGLSSVSTWLLAIARNKALSARRCRTEDTLELDQLTIADPSDDPETVIDKQDQGRVLRECVLRLSQEHREIIDLVYYHEKSMEEVSEIMGIPVGTVKSRAFYARRKLSILLTAAGIDARVQ